MGKEAGSADVFAGGVCFDSIGAFGVVGEDREELSVGEGSAVGLGRIRQCYNPFDSVT